MKKYMKMVQVAALTASAGLVLVGCTGTPETPKSSLEASIAAPYLVLDTTPGAWVDVAGEIPKGNEDIKVIQKPFLVTNMAGNCSFAVSYASIDAGGDSEKKNGEIMEGFTSKNNSKTVNYQIKTLSDGQKVDFVGTDFIEKSSDKKSPDAKVSYLTHVFGDNQGATQISLSYKCNDKKDWSLDQLTNLLDASTIKFKENINAEEK